MNARSVPANGRHGTLVGAVIRILGRTKPWTGDDYAAWMAAALGKTTLGPGRQANAADTYRNWVIATAPAK